MAKDRRSRDQKRRDKLAKKSRKVSPQQQSLAYLGKKYQTEELTPIWLQTELGIYESFVITDRKLLDQTAVAAVEKLVRQLRAGTLPPMTDSDAIQYEVGQEEDLVTESIRRRWIHHFGEEWRPPKGQLIGVLRSILGSIEKVRAPGPRSQSYMHHIAGFLTKNLGVSVKTLSADMEPHPEPEEDELVRLGRLWLHDEDQDARAEFYDLVDDSMKSGQIERILNSCHLLVGEGCDPASEVVAEIAEVCNRARASLATAMG